MPHKTLIIGWDGATFKFIKPWAAAGYLPTLARLMEQGAYAVLRAYPNMNSASAWSSIVTGCNPGKHGVFNFGDKMGKGRTWHPTTALDRARDPFWRSLSRAGQSVDIVNVPITYPADPINGYMISGMDTPDFESPNATHPPGLVQTLRAAGIEYILDVPDLKEIRQHQPDQFPAKVRTMIEARTRTLLHLMDQHSWDALMAVYIATDRMQHFYWGNRDDLADPSWELLRELYILLDSHLGRLIERAGEDTTVLVISDHGFGRGYNTQYDLNRFFARMGWLSYRQANTSLRRKLLKNLLVYGRRYLSPRLQYNLATRFPRWRQRALREDNFGNLDWSRTLVNNQGRESVFVNLQGRDPHGSVSPEEYDAFCEKVRASIMQLTDPESGKPLAKGVQRRHELYQGAFVDHAPDLVVEWDRDVAPRGICWNGEGESFVIPARRGVEATWRGNHRSEGIFIAHGPHIRRNAQIEFVGQYDIAPTVLYLQGLGLPSDLDGRVLTEAFEPAYLEEHPVVTAAPANIFAPVATEELSEQDAALIESRLRDLGYIE